MTYPHIYSVLTLPTKVKIAPLLCLHVLTVCMSNYRWGSRGWDTKAQNNMFMGIWRNDKHNIKKRVMIHFEL